MYPVVKRSPSGMQNEIETRGFCFVLFFLFRVYLAAIFTYSHFPLLASRHESSKSQTPQTFREFLILASEHVINVNVYFMELINLISLVRV